MHSKRLSADIIIIKRRMIRTISYLSMLIILFYVTANEHGHGYKLK